MQAIDINKAMLYSGEIGISFICNDKYSVYIARLIQCIVNSMYLNWSYEQTGYWEYHSRHV